MKGDDFVLLISDGASGFNQVEGQRETSFAINGEQVDITSKDSQSWRTLIATGGGNKQVAVNVSGVWLSSTEQENVRGLSISGNLDTFQIDDGVEVLECSFQVTGFEITGPQGGEQQYTATLESSGVPTIT